MKITDFGVELRKLRLEHRERQQDMAQRLGVTSALLSAIEAGNRNVTEQMLNRIILTYQLPEGKAKQLRATAWNTKSGIQIKVGKRSQRRVKVAVELSEVFPQLTNEDIRKIQSIVDSRKVSAGKRVDNLVE